MNYGTYGFPRRKLYDVNTESLDDGVIKTVASEIIAAGDLVRYSAGIKKVPYAIGLSHMPGNDTIGAVRKQTTRPYTVQSNTCKMWKLNNHNTVNFYCKTSESVVQFDIISPAGEVIVPEKVLAVTTTAIFEVVDLNNGTFMVLHGPTLQFSIYTYDGVLNIGPTVVKASAMSGCTCVLTDEGTVIISAYTSASPYNLYLFKYTDAGVIVGTEVDTGKTISSGTSKLSICPVANNRIALVYTVPTTEYLKYSIYNYDLTQYGVETTIHTYGNTARTAAVSTIAGGFIAFSCDANAYPYFRMYDAEGVALTTVITISTTWGALANNKLLKMANGGFAVVVTTTGSKLHACIISEEGRLQYITPDSGTPLGAGYYDRLAACPLDSGGIACIYAENINNYPKLKIMDNTLQSVCSDSVLYSTAPSDLSITAGCGGITAWILHNDSYPRLTYISGERRPILGIAVSSAIKGNELYIRKAGKYGNSVSVKLSNNWGESPLTFDTTSLGGGLAGTVIGKTCLLNGA